MKNFEFPGQTLENQPKARDLQQKQSKPIFGTFGTNSKSKIASVSKETIQQREQKAKQYRDIVARNQTEQTQNNNQQLMIGSQQQEQSTFGVQTPIQTKTYLPKKLQAQTNNWMIDQALKKNQTPQQALMSVNISKRQEYLQDENDDFNSKGIQATSQYQRPQTAKIRGEPIAVKQMVFYDQNNQDVQGQVKDALRIDYKYPDHRDQKSNKKQDKKFNMYAQENYISKHQNRLNEAQKKQQSTYYKSQYHYDDDYDQIKTSNSDKNLVIAGSEMNIQQIDYNRLNKNQRDFGGGDGYQGSYNMLGGQQAKAMPSTLKVSNANRFYKGFQQKLADHHQEKEQHFQSIYGQNQDENTNKSNKKSKSRPQTAKTMNHKQNKGGRPSSSRRPLNTNTSNATSGLLTHKSFKNFDDHDRDLKRERSIKNLEQMYGKSEKIEQYYNDKEIIKKRDETKQELKMLLKKYMADSDHNNICAMRVDYAQREVQELHNRMDKAKKKIEQCENQCKILIGIKCLNIVEKTKTNVMDMNEYLQKDRFIADDFEKNIERNIKNSRIAWTTDSQSVNDRIRQYENLFDDPSRLPFYDDKSRVWNLSSKFNLEENDQADDDAAILSHPFLDNRLL